MSVGSDYLSMAQGPHRASVHVAESRCLEAVTTCVGFDDMLDVTLGLNHGQVDHFIVVTSHDDTKTQRVAKKHSATVVVTDLFKKNGRNFNKGAAINAGMDHFQFHGWRLHLDVDIVLPDNFRRIAFNHSALDPECLYGADRVDVIGIKELAAIRNSDTPQHAWGSGLSPLHSRPIGARFVDNLRGYCPIGFFQLWNAQAHKAYPYSLGTAAHDDVMFAQMWPESKRHLLPSVITYHLCGGKPYYGQNWDGIRRQPRL